MNLIIQLGIFFIILGLSACTTIQNPPVLAGEQNPAWQARQQILKHLTHWQLKGKIAVQTADDSGSAVINWTEQQQHFTISLLSPLGTPSLNLQGQPGRVTLRTADGKQATAQSPEQLLVQEWGWHLPVSHLQYWIRGLPVPALSQQTQFDTAGRLQSLRQAHWTVQYIGYMRVGKIDLPSKLSITGPSLKTKIIVYEWKVG